jgi:hypothetical protein
MALHPSPTTPQPGPLNPSQQSGQMPGTFLILGYIITRPTVPSGLKRMKFQKISFFEKQF